MSASTGRAVFPQRRVPWFSGSEWGRLGCFYGAIAGFHLAGWALFLYHGHRLGPAYAGAGALAYNSGSGPHSMPTTYRR